MVNTQPASAGINKRVNKNQLAVNNVKSIPVGVKIISVWFYIVMGFLLLASIALIVGSGVIVKLVPTLALVSGLFIVIGIFSLGGAVLYFFMAKGLWKGQKWARIISIVFGSMGIFYSTISIVSMFIVDIGIVMDSLATSIFGLGLSGIIVGYLLFNNKVKEAFA